ISVRNEDVNELCFLGLFNNFICVPLKSLYYQVDAKLCNVFICTVCPFPCPFIHGIIKFNNIVYSTAGKHLFKNKLRHNPQAKSSFYYYKRPLSFFLKYLINRCSTPGFLKGVHYLLLANQKPASLPITRSVWIRSSWIFNYLCRHVSPMLNKRSSLFRCSCYDFQR